MIFRDSLCWKSLRWLKISRWTWARIATALRLRFDFLFVRLATLRCARRRRFCSTRYHRGFGIFLPLLKVAKVSSPTSIPVELSSTGRGSGSTTQLKQAYQLPFSRLMVSRERFRAPAQRRGEKRIRFRHKAPDFASAGDGRRLSAGQHV